MERELEKHPQKDGMKTEYRCGFTCVGSWATRIEKWKQFKDSFIGKYILSCESEINRLKEENERLEHYETTTIGLWATDRPDLVDDPKKIMFQLSK